MGRWLVGKNGLRLVGKKVVVVGRQKGMVRPKGNVSLAHYRLDKCERELSWVVLVAALWSSTAKNRAFARSLAPLSHLLAPDYYLLCLRAHLCSFVCLLNHSIPSSWESG